MSDYIVSARKYRPVTFDSVVGQSSLTTTLRNAILTDKLANAYLFCGPRGVGKTTCARLFAKTINCTALTAQGEACGECESCQSYGKEMRSYNVFELDAASNNSVDDIRMLTDQVRIPPAQGKYKVYIIDEVHMLSTAAFNAFLKTLEEPPKYAIFILATTEKHKILPTILSRCQTYDFSRISTADIVAHLKSVAAKEGIEAEDDALGVIAEKADGGMRDALSIFDQMSSFTGGHITYQRTIENLNVLDYDYYFSMTDHILKNEVPECMNLFNSILNKGFDGQHFISGLLLHFRNLLMSRDKVTLPLLEVSGTVREKYAQQAAQCKPKFLYRAMKLCTECDLNYKASKSKRLLVELTLIRVSQVALDPDDPTCGLGPKKLKPLFKNIPAGTATGVKAGHMQQQASRPVAQNATQVSGTKPTASSGPVPVVAPIPNIKPITVQDHGPKIPKVMASSLFTSIKGGVSQGKQEVKQHIMVEDANRDVLPLSQEKLKYFWNEFAVSLPQADAPLMNRMVNHNPVVESETSFVVTVSNDIAAHEINDHSDRILDFLRQKFNNSRITMRTKIDDTITLQKILNVHEQFEAMLKQNPSLKQLAESFGLQVS